MFAASVTVSILLALVLLASGAMKVSHASAVIAKLASVGVPEQAQAVLLYPALAVGYAFESRRLRRAGR